MNATCIRIVQQAAQAMGRNPLTASELQAIDARLTRTMRNLARTEPTWRAMSLDQRVSMAAAQAIKDIRAEAARKVANAQLQIVKTAAVEQRIATAHADSRSHALVDDMDRTHAYIAGVRQEAMGNMMALLDAAKSGKGTGLGRRLAMFLFDADNPKMTRDLAAEIFREADGSSGNRTAQEGAKAYLESIEELRQRFNAAGGDVGKLDYGYIPQPHDAARVRGAGTPAARDAWVSAILPALDRSRYLLEDGSRMSDAELRELLHSAWETIGTDGLNKVAPGSFRGTGARANRGSESRELHFKDADSYLGYMQQYGVGSMYDAVTGHVGRLSRDIGLVERYGPNPSAQMRLQLDLAERADHGLQRSFGMRPESYWDMLNGTASLPQSAKIAQLGTNARNIQTFGKLGSAVISSVTDLGTFMVTTGYNRLPYWSALANYGRAALSKDARSFLTAHGIIAEQMAGDLNRWTGDNIKQTWSGRLANSTLKLSLLNAWTDTLRRAFSMTMMQGLARLSKTEWGSLTEWDRALLERKGITPEDWSVITRAELTDYHGTEHLTPEAIRASGDPRAPEVAAKVLGMVQDESEFAVINPDLATRTLSAGGATQRGTIRGELARSVMQFKSFPVAMVSRHWRRVLDAPQVGDGSAPALANRLAYAGALMVTTTALGAIALQVKQIVAGKDPIDMEGKHAGKFWAKAVAQGGGLSIVGDMVLNDPGDDPGGTIRSIAGTMAGPAVSTSMETAGRAITDVWRASKGKPTHTAAEALNIARANAPFVNIWYAKAALDHAGMHALQENLSPGYLAKMQGRARQDFGQDYWWKPGQGAPARAPDLARAVGQ